MARLRGAPWRRRCRSEHHGIRAGAERRGDRCVGRVQLAGDGDPLRRRSRSDGEVLDAAGQGVVDFGGLSADDGAIDDGAAEKQHAQHEPFAAHAVLAEPRETDRGWAAGDEAARARQHGQAVSPSALDGDAARQAGTLASPLLLALRLTGCTTHPPRSSGPARRTSGRYGPQARAQATSTSCLAGY